MEKALVDASSDYTVENAKFFVMNQSESGWIRVSRDFCSVNDAREELETLRPQYPFARIGGKPSE